MKKIPLTQGKFALVDDADYERVSQFKWQVQETRRGNFYVIRSVGKRGKRKTVRLHSFLLPGVKPIDHIDGNGLNNCRKNLRPATNTQNLQAFRQKALGKSSLFRGVYKESRCARWRADIKAGGVHYYLGMFKSEIEAADAYDVAARKYFGEFAAPNFP